VKHCSVVVCGPGQAPVWWSRQHKVVSLCAEGGQCVAGTSRAVYCGLRFLIGSM
jgi:hypothetical protein